MELLTLFVLALLFTQAACASDGVPSSDSVGMVSAPLRLRWLLRLAKLERQKRERARWAATGLRGWIPPPKPQPPKPQPPKRSAPDEQSAPAEVNEPAKGPCTSRRVVDPEARDPCKPFKKTWLDEAQFDGLFFEQDGHIYCEACIRGKVKSDFAKGLPIDQAWQHSQLTQHCKGSKHKDAAANIKVNRDAANKIKASRSAALQALHASLVVIVTIVFWLCLESVAMIKLASLYMIIKALPVVSDSFKAIPDNYVNAARCREFVLALSHTLQGKLWKDIKASPFVSVLIDESTDISTSENMIVYFLYLKAGRPTATYVTLRHAPAVDAESITTDLLLFFAENDLDIKKVLFFCSDGASVMTGCNNGVAARLQRCNPHMSSVHCIAHRLALACADSADDMGYPEVAETVVNYISSYFNRSGKRTNELQSVAVQNLSLVGQRL